MFGVLRTRWSAKVGLLFFIVVTYWWTYLHLKFLPGDRPYYVWAATYGLIALWGGWRGLVMSRRWGGLKSILGKALIFLSVGLILQEFGQIVFSYYNIALGIDIPYPSLADVGFFGTVPFYIFGIVYLGKAAGIEFSMRRLASQLQVVLIPLSLLAVAYFWFLRGYEFDFSQPLKVFLDFGYPLGQAIYVSLALLVYSLTRQLLGGVMREKVLLLLWGFSIQFIADYNFLFQSSHGTWVNGGYGDYLYFLSYSLVAIGLISFYDQEVSRIIPAKITAPAAGIYSQIILKIIAEQQLIVGPVALEEAAKVESLRFSPDLSQVEVVGSGKEVLGALVAQYEKLFGRASIEVCKSVSKDLLSSLPDSEIPQILK